jgi:hypothetical protein
MTLNAGLSVSFTIAASAVKAVGNVIATMHNDKTADKAFL